ncbi:MAG: radical SAM family heme chaperone HemW [Xanthomonadales bacterium]|jgi:putative oxygen-independent coproporphyrinogen III oxidase|nr:radical SAM family heme chaperone HemW [Xanthomonadales bacterium]
MALTAPPLALYIHIPWCVKKCPYCDFNSHAQRDAAEHRAYAEALLADLDADLAQFGFVRERPIVSVFFGGGTPSLFAPELIARILDGCRERLRFAADIEVTMEANPGTVEHGSFAGYRAAGVNRVSFGVQSFDDAKLKRLGRIHSAEDAERAIKEAQDAGVAEINLDLMYALPEQALEGALHDVERAIALRPTHLSHYQLTLEPNTEFAARPPVLPDEDLGWDMQEACQARLAAAGYAQYETSAYAPPAHRCRHNLNYWEFGDYLGIGAGAHGKLSDHASIVRTAKLKTPKSYLAKAAGPERMASCAPITERELAFEFMMNALRLVDGVDAELYAQRTGLDRAALAPILAHAVADGLLVDDDSRFQPTADGRRLLNELLIRFLPERERARHSGRS